MIIDGSTLRVWALPLAQSKLGIFPPSPPIPSGNVAQSVTATANIPAFSPVISTGKVADSSNPSQSFGRVIGVASAAISSGSAGQVITSGLVTNPLWSWTTGDPIFVNGTSLASTPPSSGFVQQIGTALTPTSIVVSITDPVLL